MPGQLKIRLQFEPEVAAEPQLSWRQELNRAAVRRGRQPYHPRKSQKMILSILKVDQWTGFISINQKIDVDSTLLIHLLELMVKWGQLKTTPLYFGPFTNSDRTQHPPMIPPKYVEYRGFECGFRLRAK